MTFAKKKYDKKNFFFHPLAGFFGYRTVGINILRKKLSGPPELNNKQEKLQSLEKEMKILIPKSKSPKLEIQARKDLEDTIKIFRVC